MKCSQCQFEWAPPPDACPKCVAKTVAATSPIFTHSEPTLQQNPPPMGIHPPYQQTSVLIPQDSGLAIAALILGLLSCIPLCGIVAIVLGIVALVQISNGRGQLKGQGMAIVGIVCGAVITFFILPTMLYPVFVKARVKARVTSSCMSKQKQIATSIALYAQDNGQKLPPNFIVLGLSPDVLKCPARTDLSIGYGYNSNLASHSVADFRDSASHILLTADSNSPSKFINYYGDIDTARHSHPEYIASFLDGHVAVCTSAYQAVIQPKLASSSTLHHGRETNH